MSLPNPGVDLEEGQVSEQPFDANRSSPTTAGQQLEPRGLLGFEFIRHLGLSSPHGTAEHGGSVRPTSLVQNIEPEDSASYRSQAPSVGRDTPQIPGNTTRSQGANYSPGEFFADPWRQMWIQSLPQFQKYDQEITDRWKSDADGVLVFTGLFSATVAAFVIESYKRLSVDSGDQTVTLLSQVSQQLVGISNGTILPMPASPNNSPPNLHSAIRVNILFLLSLAISLTCALLATLIQQWTRRYMALSYLHDIPHERARVRTVLFTGMERFRMKQTVEAIPMLLHTSVFLFFAGLVDFFLLFNKSVAWVFIGWLGLFASLYTALTIIPNIILSCPYGTPFTSFLWRLSQMLAVITLVFTGAFATILDGFLQHSRGIWGRIYRGAPTSIAPLLDREKLVKQIATHKHWFSEGFHRRVMSDASNGSPSVDREALIWTLSRLNEDKEVEDYLSRIPGFFNSRVVLGASETMLRLMDSSTSGGDSESVLAVRLGGLLKTCLPTSSGVDPGVDKNRFNICLTAIWYYMKVYNNSKGIPMSKSFRGVFANQNEMKTLLVNDDIRINVMVLCTGSLLVAGLMKEMRRQQSPQVSEGELVFIKKALGPLWRLDLAGHQPTQFTNLYWMMSNLVAIGNVHMPAGVTFGHEVFDTMVILAEDVIDAISFLPLTENQQPDLSGLRYARGLLDLCLKLSKKCGADVYFDHLKRNDALNSLAKMLEGLDTRIARFAGPPPHPGSPTHVHGLDEGVQFTTPEDYMSYDNVSSAISAAPPMGKEALTLTLAELREDDEFEAFVARISNLYGPYHVSDTSIDNILDLMAPSSEGGSTLAHRLHNFFKACLPGMSTWDPDVRKRRLRVCLAAIWSHARAYCNSDPRMRPIPGQFQRLFADSDDMDIISAEGDANTRVMVLCITSLLVTKIVKDIRHRSGNPPVSEEELAFVQRALGSFWRPDLPLVSPGPAELANFLAMLDGLSKLARQEMSPLETLGREASEALEILARAVQDSLPDDPPQEHWGSSAPVIEDSRRALQQCRSLLRQMSEGEDSLGKRAWVDALIGRMTDLDDNLKLAQPRSEPEFFTGQRYPRPLGDPLRRRRG